VATAVVVTAGRAVAAAVEDTATGTKTMADGDATPATPIPRGKPTGLGSLAAFVKFQLLLLCLLNRDY
jgi:hypothetical protein